MNTPPSVEYQMVFEFKGDSPRQFERLIALESKMDEKLQSGVVDGNDVGKGVVNIFVITKEPDRCFEEIMGMIAPAKLPLSAAAYRESQGDRYVRLWPEGDSTAFELK